MSASYEETTKTKSFLPFRLNHVPEAIIQKAREELNETEEKRASGIAELRKLVEKKFICRTDDTFLLMYLRVRKFDLNRAFQMLTNCIEAIKSYPDCYAHCDVEKLKSLFRKGFATFLPYRDSDGCVVVVFEMDRWNPDEHDIGTVIQLMDMILLFAVEDTVTQVCGVKMILNFRGMGLRQIRCLTPRYLLLMCKGVRNILPMRFKAINICNETVICQYIWTVVKVFLSEKIKQRFHFHGNKVKNLHKVISKDILPKDYGGDNLHFNAGDWSKTDWDGYYETFRLLLLSDYKDQNSMAHTHQTFDS